MVPQAANTNTPAAKPGEAFYPEMGERPDGTALFQVHGGYRGCYVTWLAERDAEARAAFKRLRIQPSSSRRLPPRLFTAVHGGVQKWSVSLTYAAGDKLMKAKLAVLDLLLD